MMMSTATPTRTLDSKQREWIKAMGAALDLQVADAAAIKAPSPGSKQADEKVGSGIPTEELLGLAPEVIKILEKIGGGARACAIKVFNDTGQTLIRGEAVHESGSNFREKLPADKIEPGKEDEFVTSSPEGHIPILDLPTGGAIGHMPYRPEKDGGEWMIEWRNPVAGTVKGFSVIKNLDPKRFIPKMLHGNGHKTVYRFTLTDLQKPSTPPGPGPQPGPTPGAVDAASSCHITVTNDTNVTLTFGGSNHERGNFMTPPAKSIKPGQSITFVSVEVPNAAKKEEEGCKGHVLWQVGSPNVLWRIEWDNPEQEQNKVSHSFNPPNPGFNSANFIGQGEENVPVTFTLSEAGGGGGPVPPPSTAKKLKFTVVDAAEQPIPEALVEITDIQGASGVLAKKSGKTDAKGKVDFDLPPAEGTMQVSVRANATGFEEHRLIYKLPEDGFDQTIHLSKAAAAKKLVITVVDSADKPLPGVLVEIESDAENVKLPKKSDKTNDKGKVEFELPAVAKPFTLKAQATLAGFDVEKRAYKLPDEGFEHVIHMKSASRVRTANFNVQDTTEHKPLPGATVEISGIGKSKPTDERGRAEFELPPGAHSYTVKKDEFLPASGKIEMPADKDVFETVLMSKAEKKKFEPPDESKQPTLRRGAPKGDKWVEYLQQLLGFEGKDVDGDFGGKTEAAVKEYQKKNGLLVDGIVGNQTWASLRKAPPEKPSGDGRKPNTFVEKGQEARWYTEKKAEVLTLSGDTLKLKLVSLGDKEVEGVMARVRITAEGGLEHTDDYRISAPEKKLPEGGFIHSVSVPGLSSKFPAGKRKLTVEAYMPKDLGGDLFKDEIEVSLSGRRP
jgi:hypothetical protein